jgi:CheY-like chemotaxis protein
MPRKSGHKLLYELKRDKALSNIPVLVVTAHAKDDLGKGDLDDVLENRVMFGPCTYLEKPVKPRSYVRSIQRALGLPVSEEVEEKIDLKEELQDSMQNASPDALREALEALRRAKEN